MIITKVSQQKKNKSRFNIDIDGEFAFGAFESTIAQFNLYRGKEVTTSEINEVVKQDLFNWFWDKSLNFSSRKNKTEKMVSDYLKLQYKKKIGELSSENYTQDLEVIIQKVIDKLKKYNYLSDEDFAVNFVNSRLKNKPRSKRMLEQELYSKGVDKETISEVLNSTTDDEYEVLKQTYEKKYKDQKFDRDDAKKIRFLMGKGFDWDLISKLIKEKSE